MFDKSGKDFAMLSNETDISLGDSGKAVMDHIYDQSDPRAYFRSLRMLRYLIPDAVQPVLQHLISARRRATDCQEIKLLDLGCSYGVTGHLLRSGQSMDETFHHYMELASCARAEVIEKDRTILNAHSDKDVMVVGLDVAQNACAYAIDCGAIDAAVVANLEEDDPTPEQVELMSGADLLVSTGCIGYVGVPTMVQILDATGDSRPWMAHFVMRMFDFTPIRNALTQRRYVTRRGTIPVYQRKFASPDEQEEIVNRLVAMGRDPHGLEDNGSAYADLYISRPANDRGAIAEDVWDEILRTV